MVRELRALGVAMWRFRLAVWAGLRDTPPVIWLALVFVMVVVAVRG